MTFSPSGSFRGGIELSSSIMYAGFQDELYTVKPDGEIKYYADIAGSNKFFIARNQNTTPDVVIVAENTAYQSSGSTFVAYSDTDVGSPICVCYHDGYFMFGYSNGDIIASGLNATTINTLDAANAASNADGLVQLWSYSGQLYAAGEKTIEIWGYPVNNTGFPLTRVGYHVTPGLIAQFCVAGFEAEWGNPPIYVGTDNTVRQLVGYQAVRISTPDLERLIANVEDKTTLEAMAYRVAGTAFWQLSSPDWTWVYNANNPGWFERKSDGQERSRFTGGAVYAFGKWFVGDNQVSQLLHVLHTVNHEGESSPLVATIITPSVKAFPNRIRVARADFDLVVPAVTADTTAPTVDISWSDDGGATFSNPVTRSLGTSTSDTTRRITVLNTGYSKPIGRRWKLECSDDVNFALLGGDMSAEVRAK